MFSLTDRKAVVTGRGSGIGRAMAGALAAALAERTMVGRNGTPDDYRGIAAFLCSDAAAFVTGQTIAVDGGFSAP